MSYYSDDNFVMPAKDAQVVAWYRDKPASFPDIPRHPKDGWARSEWHHFSDEERQQVNERRRLKKHVLEAIKLNAGLHGPFNRSVLEEWHYKCSLKRKMIVHARAELAEGRGDPFEIAANIKEYKEEHRRLITVIRSLRTSMATQWTPICRYPFYVEPNCNYVPEEDYKKAEGHGVVWHRVEMTMPIRDFYRLQRRFQKSGRIEGFWTCEDDLDDLFDARERDKGVRCMFAFSDPDEAEKLTEELVWIKMRF